VAVAWGVVVVGRGGGGGRAYASTQALQNGCCRPAGHCVLAGCLLSLGFS
jgi:hypothetical protein